MYKNINKIMKIFIKNKKIISLVLLGIILTSLTIYKVKEKFTPGERLLILYKEKSENLDHHNINISRLELTDENDKKIPLTFHSTSDEVGKDRYKLMLDGKDNTYFHSGYRKEDNYYNGTSYSSHIKRYPKWIAFTFPNNVAIKKIYIKPRTNQEKRMAGMELMIFNKQKATFWGPETRGSDKIVLKTGALPQSTKFSFKFPEKTDEVKEYKIENMKEDIFKSQQELDAKNKLEDYEDEYSNYNTIESLRGPILELNEINRNYKIGSNLVKKYEKKLEKLEKEKLEKEIEESKTIEDLKKIEVTDASLKEEIEKKEKQIKARKIAEEKAKKVLFGIMGVLGISIIGLIYYLTRPKKVVEVIA